MNTSLRSLTFIGTAALATLAAILASCSSYNADFCTTSNDCESNSLCDTQQHTCIANSPPDGGPAKVGADTTAEAVSDFASGLVEAPSVPPPVCDGANQQCVKAAPDGWRGPMARAEASGSLLSLGNCGGAYDRTVGLFSNDMQVSDSCSCSCSVATNVSCGNATLREWTSPSENACEMGQCGVIGGTCLAQSQSLAPGFCRTIPYSMKNEPFLRAQFGAITSATCASPSASGDVSSAFSTQTRLCEISASANADGCASDEVCAPTPEGEFAPALCIAQQGDHACPETFGYTEKTLLYTGISDNRSCSADSCSCSSPTGSCGGKIELHNGGFDKDICTTPALATLQYATSVFGSNNLCQALPANATTAIYVEKTTGHNCRKLGEATTTGQVTATGVTTLCCAP